MGNLFSSPKYNDDGNSNLSSSQSFNSPRPAASDHPPGHGTTAGPSGLSSFSSMLHNTPQERLRSNSEMSADDQSRRPSIYTRSPVTSIGDSQDSGSPLPTTLNYLSDNDDTTPTTATPLLPQTPLRDANHKDWWMPDNACKECYKCQERFHFFFRRHHCRLCGLIFCYKCSGNFVYGHEYGFQNQELVRACDDCYAVLPTLMNNTKSPRNYNARRQNHRPQSSSHSNRSLRSGKRRGGSGGGVPGTGSKSSNQTNSSSGRINRRNKKKSHKISRTGTEGINARFDGQTYPAGYVGVNGADLEFDDIHSDQE